MAHARGDGPAPAGRFSAVAGLLSDEALAFARAQADVAYVEYDQPVTLQAATATAHAAASPSWGLDRVDSRLRPVDGTFTTTLYGDSPGSTVGTVDAYVLDSGVYAGHSDFGGRVVHGMSVFGDNDSNDCHGHGTHVAGTVGSATYGVAPNVRIVAVRVVDCSGNGFASGVIMGLNYAAAEAAANAPSRRSVVNLSVGAGTSQALNDAVEEASDDGVVVVVAAGNQGTDACSMTPSSSSHAVTVGATDKSDALASYSNWGTCVDILAPGTGIVSLSKSGAASSTNTQHGTSMASPHVAGAAASLLMAFPTATVAEVRSAIQCAATPQVVAAVTGNAAATPNLLLHVPAGGWGDAIGDACAAAECTANACSGHGTCEGAPASVYGVAERCVCDCGWEGRLCDIPVFMEGPFPEGVVAGDTRVLPDFFGHSSGDAVITLDVPAALSELSLTLCSTATDFDTTIHILTPAQCPLMRRNLGTADAIATNDDGPSSACAAGEHSAPFTPSAIVLQNVYAGQWKIVVGGYNDAQGSFELSIDADGDCYVDEWGEWGACTGATDGNCDGTSTRTRGVASPAVAGYAACPSLSEDRVCGSMCSEDCGAECGGDQWESVRCTVDAPRTCSDCATCDSGEFESAACTLTSDRACGACAAECATCDGDTAADCTACADGHFDSGGADPPAGTCQQCSGACGDGSYVTAACSATADRACASCDASCATCDGGSAADCLACAAGYFWDAGSALCAECRAACGDDEYESQACTPTSERVCTSCDDACATCSGAGPSACTACAPGNFDTGASEPPSGTCAACRAPCADGQFAAVECTATSDRLCLDCHDNCDTCEGGPTARDCTLCASGFFDDDGECVACRLCGTEGYETAPCTPTSDRECTLCSTACDRCYNFGPAACFRCADGYYDSEGTDPPLATCVQCSSPDCGDDRYVATACSSTADRTCGDCAAECDGCTGGTAADCVLCADGHFRDDDGVCTACKACNPAIERVVVECSQDGDVQCEFLENCEPGSYAQQREPSLVCAACSAGCDEGMHESTACSSDADRVCATTTVCGPEEFETVEPTATSDRQCAACSPPCDGEHWELQACAGARDRLCALCTSCDAHDEYVVAECGAATDTVCAACGSDVDVCRADCELGNWRAWGACSSACGTGTQLRTRIVVVAPRYGGAPCGPVTETRACACPDVDASSDESDPLGMCSATPDTCASVVVSIVVQVAVADAEARSETLRLALPEAAAVVVTAGIPFPDGEGAEASDIVASVISAFSDRATISASLHMSDRDVALLAAAVLVDAVEDGAIDALLASHIDVPTATTVLRLSVHAFNHGTVAITRVAGYDAESGSSSRSGPGSDSDSGGGSGSASGAGGPAGPTSGQASAFDGSFEDFVNSPWGVMGLVAGGIVVVCGVGSGVYVWRSSAKRQKSRSSPVKAGRVVPVTQSRTPRTIRVSQSDTRTAEAARSARSSGASSGQRSRAGPHGSSPARSLHSGRSGHSRQSGGSGPSIGHSGGGDGLGGSERIGRYDDVGHQHHGGHRGRAPQRESPHDRWQRIAASESAVRTIRHGSSSREPHRSPHRSPGLATRTGRGVASDSPGYSRHGFGSDPAVGVRR
uniref:subtilisin n=1 Tax=Bicosoecida sp. CB-2014 TaxID=1486930 RepID=A0A7S1GFY9_9STRA